MSPYGAEMAVTHLKQTVTWFGQRSHSHAGQGSCEGEESSSRSTAAQHEKKQFHIKIDLIYSPSNNCSACNEKAT